ATRAGPADRLRGVRGRRTLHGYVHAGHVALAGARAQPARRPVAVVGHGYRGNGDADGAHDSSAGRHDTLMEAILLAVIMLVSLFMIPLGLPGTWVMIAAGVGYSILVPNSIGMFALIGTVALAVVAEVFEFTLAGKYARKYGGSK